MSITKEIELIGMKNIGEVVAITLKKMVEYARPGMSTKELDQYGASLLQEFGARSAPELAYGFPGWTCISVGQEFCHGIPSERRILKAGELVNIDVSAELGGFWADNGSSFILGAGSDGVKESRLQHLVDASRAILYKAIASIRHGVRIADVGGMMETEARRRGYRVIKNLGGHGTGRSLHEQPDALLNFRDPSDRRRLQKNSVVAIETFIATESSYAVTLEDGWTLVGDRGGYMAQHEHTIVVTDGEPMILTAANGIFP